MNLLHLLSDGALAAAELLALLFVAPATAAEPMALEPALQRPVQLHRLSTTVDVHLLGSLADVRVAQRLLNDGESATDIGARQPAFDEEVDALRVACGESAPERLAAADDGVDRVAGHARLSPDEAIADALLLASGADALVEIVKARPRVPSGGSFRVALPARVSLDAPYATLVRQDDAWFLVVVPHRRALRAALVLRPEYGAAESIALGAVDPAAAVVVPIADAAQYDDLANGVIELELEDRAATFWTTLVPRRAEERSTVQAGATE